jgi:hypothetical protein
LKQQAADVVGHRSGRLAQKIAALMVTIDQACAVLEGRRYKTELFEVLEGLPSVLARHQVIVRMGF